MGENGDERVNKYLALINVNPNDFWNSNEIPVVNTRFVVLATLNDYFNKKIDIDEVFEVGVALEWIIWSEKWNNLELEKHDRKLAKILENISDDYELEHSKIETEKRLQPILLEYYEKYKYIITPYIKN